MQHTILFPSHPFRATRLLLSPMRFCSIPPSRGGSKPRSPVGLIAEVCHALSRICGDFLCQWPAVDAQRRLEKKSKKHTKVTQFV